MTANATFATLLIVSGLPCSGKSTLSEYLRQQLCWPLLAKDALKETLFDTLGTHDRDWSRRLSRAAYALMFRQATELILTGHSCIVEGNFRHGEYEGQFGNISNTGARLVQAHCRAPSGVLVARFRERMHTRHSGHADAESFAAIESELLNTAQRPLAIEASVVDCNFESGIARWVEKIAADVIERLTG